MHKTSCFWRSFGSERAKIIFCWWIKSTIVCFQVNIDKAFDEVAEFFLIIKIMLTLHKKMKLFIKDFFSKCDQIRIKLSKLSRLLKKSLKEDFNFFTVLVKLKLSNLIWFQNSTQSEFQKSRRDFS